MCSDLRSILEYLSNVSRMKPLEWLEFELQKSACEKRLIADRAGQKKNSSKP